MLQSHVIEIDGAFVGAAVRLDRGYRFIATDIRLDDLDGTIWPTLVDVKRPRGASETRGRRSRAWGRSRSRCRRIRRTRVPSARPVDLQRSGDRKSVV